MRNMSNDSFNSVIGVVYLGMAVNVLLVAAWSPMLLLLVTTDPSVSWPAIALAAPLCAPGVVAAFTAFHEHSHGQTTVVRTFLSAWRGAWRRPVPFATLATALLVVLLVDLRAVSSSEFGPAVAPVLIVLALLTIIVAVLGMVAFAEAPDARILTVIRVCLFLGVKRWYVTAVSLCVLGLQIALFTGIPAIGIGLTAAPVLYVVWGNSRYSLRPVLNLEEIPVK